MQDRFWAPLRFGVAAISRRIDSRHRSGCFSVLAAVGFTGATIRAPVASTRLLPPQRRLDRQVDCRFRRSDFLVRLRHTVWFARSPAICQVEQRHIPSVMLSHGVAMPIPAWLLWSLLISFVILLIVMRSPSSPRGR